MVGWETTETDCVHVTQVADDQATCPRPALAGHERCPYHLPAEERSGVDLVRDLERRITALAEGEASINNPAYRQFREVTLPRVDLSGVDLSGLRGRDERLDFRGSTIQGKIRIEDCDISVSMDLREAEVGGVECTDSSLRDLRLTGATLKTQGTNKLGVDISDTKIRGGCFLNSCQVEGSIRLRDLETAAGRLTAENAHILGTVIIRNSSGETCTFKDATIRADTGGELAVLRSPFTLIDATRLDCDQLKISGGHSSRRAASGQSGLPTLDLHNATVRQTVTIKELQSSRLLMKGLTADTLSLAEVSTSADHPGIFPEIQCTDAELDQVTFTDVSAANGVSLAGSRVESRATFKDCEIPSLRASNGEVEHLTLTGASGEFEVVVIDESLIDTVTVDASEVAGIGVSESTCSDVSIDSGCDSLYLSGTRITNALTCTNLDALLLWDSDVAELECSRADGRLRIEKSRISESGTIETNDLETLTVTKSRIENLELTPADSLPLCNHVELEAADLPGARLAHAEDEPTVEDQFSAIRSTLERADLRHLSTGDGIDFAESNLSDAQLQNADLGGANLTNALLSRAKLAGTTLTEANLHGAVLGDAQITKETEFGSHVTPDPRLEGTLEAGSLRDIERAQSVYKRLENLMVSSGQSSRAREMLIQQNELKREINRRNDDITSKWMFDFWRRLANYGTNPILVTKWALGTLLVFTIIYCLGEISVNPPGTVPAAIGLFFQASFYSLAVFFSFDPAFFDAAGFAQYFVPFETGAGAVLVAVFIYTLGQRTSL